MNASTLVSLVSIAPTTMPVRLTPTASDDALIAAISTGDRHALGLLYARHADTLRAVAASSLPKHEKISADDIVQEVFLALLEGRSGNFQPAKGKALAWLKGIARREATLHSPPTGASPRKRGDS